MKIVLPNILPIVPNPHTNLHPILHTTNYLLLPPSYNHYHQPFLRLHYHGDDDGVDAYDYDHGFCFRFLIVAFDLNIVEDDGCDSLKG
jgi:hypothetical protein